MPFKVRIAERTSGPWRRQGGPQNAERGLISPQGHSGFTKPRAATRGPAQEFAGSCGESPGRRSRLREGVQTTLCTRQRLAHASARTLAAVRDFLNGVQRNLYTRPESLAASAGVAQPSGFPGEVQKPRAPIRDVPNGVQRILGVAQESLVTPRNIAPPFAIPREACNGSRASPGIPQCTRNGTLTSPCICRRGSNKPRAALSTSGTRVGSFWPRFRIS